MSTPPLRPNVNSMAVVSFVVSFLGICGAVIGTVLAIIGLRAIKRTGERGRGLAIAALWISAAWYAATAVLIAIAVVTGLFSDQAVPVGSLSSGTCVESFDENASVTQRVLQVPCSQGHEGEIVGTFNPDGEAYPGADELAAVAAGVCGELFEHYTDQASAGRPDAMRLLIPSDTEWRDGNRRIVCMAAFGSQRHGSIRG